MHRTPVSWRRVMGAAIAVLAVTLFAVVPSGTAAPASVAAHNAAHHAAAAGNCKRHPAGSATWSDWEFPANISPYQGDGSAAGEVGATYLEGLLTVNQNGQLIPQMLTSVPRPHGLTV